MNFPLHSLTWIVKGTFALRAGGIVVPTEEQAFPTADEFYPDDEEGKGGPRYESDFAYFKPRADILVVGNCHAPNGVPATHCRAAVRVGSREKAIAVVGNRQWESRWLAWEASPPEPFEKMPLRYEHSFGGPKFPANPVGKGARATETEDGDRLWPLPNLEDPSQLITGTGSKPPVSGLGPTNRKWSGRREKIGTYKGSYRKTRWPWFAEDFDWGYMNAAPTDLQVEGYLRGDEKVVLENLHPRHARYEFQLPGIRVRSFVNKAGAKAPVFEEVDLKLDTLWIDMENEKLVLLWRGWTPTTSEEFEDILDLYVATEQMAQAPQSREVHLRTFLGTDAAAGQPFEPEEPPPMEDEAPPAAEEDETEDDKKAKAGLEAAAAFAKERLKGLKLDPASEKKMADAQAAFLKQASALPATNEKVMATLNAALSKAGVSLDLSKPLPAPAPELAPLLAAAGITPELAAAEPAVVAAMGAVLGKLADTPAKVAAMMESLSKTKEKYGFATTEEPPPEPVALPPLTREAVAARAKAREPFEKLNLSGLDLSGLDFAGLYLGGSRLDGSVLRNAKLAGTDLTGASLVGADLSGADLKTANAAKADFTDAKLRGADCAAADFAGAKLTRADMTQAKLAQTVLEEADLRDALCIGVAAKEAILARANLSGARFKDADCEKADFSKARLDKANFQSAKLVEARFEQAAGTGVDLTGATLTKLKASGSKFPSAILAKSKGAGSIWKGCDLSGADLRFAHMPESLFKGANLRGANLSGSEMRGAVFSKADLSGAKMRQMNLFQGSLEKAKLSQTDLSGSNLYEVEFLDAVLDRTIADGANTKMTKLELV